MGGGEGDCIPTTLLLTSAAAILRDWSLITIRGGGLQFKTGGAEKVLAMLKGGGVKLFWGSFYLVA